MTLLVPVEWLKEFVDFDLSPETLAHQLTMAGLEVEEIREIEGQKVFSTYVTPNRPDLLSVFGVARNIAALLDIPLKTPAVELPETGEDVNKLVSVDIQTPVNCPRYSARVITGIKVVDSPKWMQDRLIAAGMRPINNVVDSTNYVLLEMGQPLHAFDYDLVAGHKIIVRQAGPGEKITTIDGEERELDPTVMLIADAKNAVAVAGVMGGFDSEVTSKTTNILLESAYFNRLSIRRTARKLQMSTEASYRFERGIDPGATIQALDRVAQLITETGGGSVAAGYVDMYPSRIEPVEVSIRPSRASMILGFDVTEKQIEDYLTRLGMSITRKEADKLDVLVPTFRPDITREEDLIEEVGIIYGYERIPDTLPSGLSMQGRDSDQGLFATKISSILISAGLQEVTTSSMVTKAENVDQIAIKNPLNDDLCCLRGNLMLDLLGVVSYNSTRGIRDIGAFEIGHVFGSQDEGLLVEKLCVGSAITGSLWGQTWNIDRSSLEVDFFLLKGILENLFERLGIMGVNFKPATLIDFHPTRAAIIAVGDMQLGVMGQINPQAAARYDVPERTYVFELDFDQLMELSGKTGSYRPLSRYPAVTRDLAVIVADDVSYKRVADLISEEAGDLLESLSLFDVYTGTPLPAGQKNLAFSAVFRSRERTLRDEEVDDSLERIRQLLAAELNASFRDT